MRSVSYTEIMIDDLKSLPDRKRELTTIENPLVHHFKDRQIADIERLLTVVSPEQMEVIKTLYFEKKTEAQAASMLGMAVQKVREIKNESLLVICRCRYGAMYRP